MSVGRASRWKLVAMALLLCLVVTASADEPAKTAAAAADQNPPTAETAWSAPVRGLRGRLELHRREINHGTLLLSATLHLENLTDLANPMQIPWSKASLKFELLDSQGKEVTRHSMVYDGMSADPVDLVLPYGGKLSFDITQHGIFVGDEVAALDLGLENNWLISKEDGPCTLQGTIEIGATKAENPHLFWHGRLELPPVALPLEGQPLDPATAEETIRRLGSTMVDKQNRDREKARIELSFILDPRVIPWYLKLLEHNTFEAKAAALDRLSRFNSDEALAGIQQALLTKAADIGNCTTPELAQSSAESVRHSAAVALARSPHPGAKAILLTLRNDRSMPIRMTVLHELGEMKDEASLEMIREMTKDPNEMVSRAAEYYLDLRTKPDGKAEKPVEGS